MPGRSDTRRRARPGRGPRAVCLLAGVLLVAGCTQPNPPATQPGTADPAAPLRLPGVPQLPARLGVVENVGLQLPVVSPDGQQILYLRTDTGPLSPMTLFGSSADTPAEGTLSIWIRPTTGATAGRRLSSQRWAHSPVWSPTGRAVAYVVNEPPGSAIVHVDLSSGQETVLGPKEGIACLPHFDADDRTLLFCVGTDPAGPFRICRQAVGQAAPTVLTAEDADCLFPLMTDGADRVICTQAVGGSMIWARCGTQGTTALTPSWGLPGRPEVLHAVAGIADPLSPQRDGIVYYDAVLARICTLLISRQVISRHRAGTIAACWLDDGTICTATAEGVFLVDAATGVSATLLTGPWIPSRHVAADRRLILLGQQGASHLAIWEIAFAPGVSAAAARP